jgi:hypothetical protein
LLADDLGPLRNRFSAVLRDRILSGAFADEWSRRQDGAVDPLPELRRRAAELPLLRAERRVREEVAPAPTPS